MAESSPLHPVRFGFRTIGFWNVEAALHASDNGHYALMTNASCDLYLPQRLVLQPQ